MWQEVEGFGPQKMDFKEGFLLTFHFCPSGRQS